MKYRLGIRRLTESDIGVDCPYLPEPEDFEMYLNAFVEELNNFDVVVSAASVGECVLIELVSESDFSILHNSVKDVYRPFSQYFATTGFRAVA